MPVFEAALNDCLGFEVIEATVLDGDVVDLVHLEVLREVYDPVHVGVLRHSLPLNMKFSEIFCL